MMNDICGKRKVILYGLNGFTSQCIEVLEQLGVEIAYCVDNIDNPQNLISKLHVDIRYKNISEIKNEDMTDKLILVIKIDVTEKGIKSADYTEVEKIGGVTFFKEMRLFWSGLEYAWRDAKVEHGFGHIKDPLLTYTWIYKATSKKYPGYVVFGNEETAKKRIIILGNSTADAGLYEKFIKSWPEFLSIKLRSSVIFCGAIGGYNSKQELLKLLRDGRQLKPDLVISYSGICDIGQAHMEGFPFVRKPADMKSQEMILGIRKDTTVAEEWVESEIMMKTIANAYSAEFIGIFHPILGNKSKLSCEERLLEVLEEREFSSLIEQKKFQDEVKQYIKNVPYIYDITNVFENRRERIFRDNTHLTEEGNSMIADAVYKIIERI